MGNNTSHSPFGKAIKNKKIDEFIIKHYRQNKDKNCSVDIEELNKGRTVFIGTNAIFKCWQDISSATLYTSLLLLPMKKQWIYSPNKHKQELEATIPLAKDNAETKKFLELLQWKDSQNLVMFMMDDWAYPNEEANNSAIHPFWYHLSQKLESLSYRGLHLTSDYYQSRDFIHKFETESGSILNELYFLTMEPLLIQEIIWQSNPDSQSLNPVINSIQKNVFRQEDGDWFMLDDYEDLDSSGDRFDEIDSYI